MEECGESKQSLNRESKAEGAFGQSSLQIVSADQASDQRHQTSATQGKSLKFVPIHFFTCFSKWVGAPMFEVKRRFLLWFGKEALIGKEKISSELGYLHKLKITQIMVFLLDSWKIESL